MIGFTFKNIHSSTFNIGARSIDRSLVPQVRKNVYTIPGRDGTLDFGLNTYEPRPIKVKLALGKNGSWEELRAKARDVAKWVSGSGLLIFDDEPDKAYQASVYEFVGINQIEVLPIGLSELVFEAQPFAESLNYVQVYQESITSNAYSIPVKVGGSRASCPIITIKNTGNTVINQITITRKAEI